MHLPAQEAGGVPLAVQPMYTLSGGQKSRVALAKVGGAWHLARQGRQQQHAMFFWLQQVACIF